MTTPLNKLNAQCNQAGSTLMVSLVILVIMTVIGIAAMSNSGMESTMARNFQLSNTEFQLSETAIETLIFKASQGPANNPIASYTVAGDVIRNVDTTVEGNSSSYKMDSGDAATIDPDPNDYLGPDSGVKIDAEVTFHYKLPTQMCPGGAGTGSCNVYSIDADAKLDGGSDGLHHIQHLSIVVP